MYDHQKTWGVSMRGLIGGVAAILLLLSPIAGSAQTRLTFGTDWLAEAEHGGFYQALALGFYKKHGLDVTIRMGGPQANPPQAIATGIVDFQMSSGSFAALNMAQQDIPVVAVAAFFQKDPQVLISHPGTGSDTLAEMKGKPIMISAAARSGYWLFLKAKYGFTDTQIRPYAFSMAPFLADKTAIQQGFVTSEPYQIERMSGVKPVVNLLADNGYTSYSNIVLTQSRTVAEHPEIVSAFIEASIEGWNSYIHGDPKPGNDLILRDNKEMTQDTIDGAIRLMKQYGIVDSGDSLTLGIGAMTDARWQSFFKTMALAGLYKPDLDYKKAYTLQFVDAKYGMATTAK
jgi:NitT/TauT family transport system substrate-binding protein